MARQRLTKPVIAAIEVPKQGRGTRYYDTKLPGFGVVAYPSGRKSYFVEYGPRGRRRVMTLGLVEEYLTVEDAREDAAAKRAKYREGEDPLNARRAARAMQSFKQWADQYIRGVRRRKKRPEADEFYLKQAKERWGRKLLSEITPGDIEGLMRAMVEKGKARHAERLRKARKRKDEDAVARLKGAKAPGFTTANRCFASVRTCLEVAWRQGLIDSNPAARVKKYRENEPRSRVLSDDEMDRLLDALSKEPDFYVRAAFRLLIETGARLSEVLRAEWADVDLDEATWRIPSPKSGRPQVLPLASQTVAMMRRLKRRGPYLIVGRSPGKPRADLKGPWDRLKVAAKLEDVHIHDIRRTFGLHMARSANLHVASKLLRHSSVQITERVYAPLGIDELRKHLEKAQRRGQVVPIQGGKTSEGRGR